MPLNDAVSLSAYGINNRSSEITHRSGHTFYTTYYDSSREICGSARSRENTKSWTTTHVEVQTLHAFWIPQNGATLGHWSGPLRKDTVVYTHHKLEEVETEYFDLSRQLRGTSKSVLGNNGKWVTTYSSAILTSEQRAESEAQRLAQVRAAEQANRVANLTYAHTAARLKSEAKIREQERAVKVRESYRRISAARKTVTIEQLKKYYLSHSSFFSIGRGIFIGKSLDKVLEILEYQASLNPGGASEKTLKKFGLQDFELGLTSYGLAQFPN